ncbi:hypothetical protein GJAV_G00268330 [Gymnothorax javanicus]|nr:hypothetical protein GJAV_G00268330 [Gymnothorax javanicus]
MESTRGLASVQIHVVRVIAPGALILGCWCYLRLQWSSQAEDEESIVGEGETKEPFLLVQYSARAPRVERKMKLFPSDSETHS